MPAQVVLQRVGREAVWDEAMRRSLPGFAESSKFYVRFTPKSGHVRCNGPCLLWANSGHR